MTFVDKPAISLPFASSNNVASKSSPKYTNDDLFEDDSKSDTNLDVT